MKIGRFTSRRGRIIRSRVQLGRASKRTNLPVWIAAGRQSGGTMFVSAGIHGDEVNAITALQRFVDQLNLTELAGQLVIVPVANVSGFRARTRCVPEDGRDLNRAFPGDPHGTLSERIAHFIMTELVAATDCGVDLHDCGTGSVLLPHARLLDHRAPVLKFGAAFGTEIVMKATLPPDYHGLLTVEARKRYDLPFFHVEMGGEPVLWPDIVAQGVVGLRNLLIHLGMLPGKMVLPRVQYILPGRDDMAVVAPMEGLLTTHVTLGQPVNRGHTLATIVNPLTRARRVIRARRRGFVLALNVRALVEPGEDVVCVIGTGTVDGSRGTLRSAAVERRLNRAGPRVMIRRNSINFCCVEHCAK